MLQEVRAEGGLRRPLKRGGPHQLALCALGDLGRDHVARRDAARLPEDVRDGGVAAEEVDAAAAAFATRLGEAEAGAVEQRAARAHAVVPACALGIVRIAMQAIARRMG
jgi:hypothetical protein